MKFLSLLLLLGLPLFDLNAQVLETDAAKLTNIEIITSGGDFKITEVAWINDNNVLTQSRKMNPISFQIMGADLKLGKYNVADQTGIDADLKGSGDQGYHYAHSSKNGAVVFYSNWDKNEQRTTLYYKTLNLDNLSLSEKENKLFSVAEFNGNIGLVVSEFHHSVSPNGSKIALSYASVNDNLERLAYNAAAKADTYEKERIQVGVVNEDMSVSWNKSFETNYHSKYIDIEEVAVDDKGNAYVLCKIYLNENRKEQVEGNVNTTYTIFGFFDNGDDVKEFKVNNPYDIIGKMDLVLDNAQNLWGIGLTFKPLPLMKNISTISSLNPGGSSMQDYAIFKTQTPMNGQLIVKIDPSKREKTLNKIHEMESKAFDEFPELGGFGDTKTFRNVTLEKIHFDAKGNLFVATRSLEPLGNSTKQQLKQKTALLVFNFDANGEFKNTQTIHGNVYTSGFGFIGTTTSLNVIHAVHPANRIFFKDLDQSVNSSFDEEYTFTLVLSELKFGNETFSTKKLSDLDTDKGIVNALTYTKVKDLNDKYIFFKGTVSDTRSNKIIMTEQPSKNFVNLTCVELK